MTETKNKAYELYKNATLPNPASEAWRKIRLDHFRLDDYPTENARLETEIISENGESEIQILTLAEVLQNPESHLSCRIEEQIQKRLENDPDIFTLLAISQPMSAHVIVVEGGENTVTISHKGLSGQRFTTLCFVIFTEQSNGCIIEEFRNEKTNQSNEACLWAGLTEILCNKSSNANYVSMRRPGDMDAHFLRTEATLAEHAKLLVSVLHAGGQTGKSFVRATASEEGAQFRGIGFNTGWAAQFHDMEMEAIHLANHTTSSLLYKTVMQDRSHSVFNGNLIIPAGVRDINSHQVNNNILLSKRARAESMPRLVINSENVSCEHGATVGELDEEAMFFLMSRGLPEAEARKMLIEGFMGQIFSETPIGPEKTESYWNEIHPLLKL